MEVRMLQVNDVSECPFSGAGMVVVLEVSENSARLMYPMTLDEWSMPYKDRLNQQQTVDREGFINSTDDKDLLWPENHTEYAFDPNKLAHTILNEIQRQYLYSVNRPTKASRGTLVSVIATLQGVSEEIVDAELRALKESTVPIQKPKAPKPKQLKISDEDNTNMAKPKKEKKVSGHREGILYLATPKLDADKFRGQRKCVAKALGAYSTPKSLTDIVSKVQAGGEYKVNADGGITDSVHFHLRELVKEGLVKESKDEKVTEAVA